MDQLLLLTLLCGSSPFLILVKSQWDFYMLGNSTKATSMHLYLFWMHLKLGGKSVPCDHHHWGCITEPISKQKKCYWWSEHRFFFFNLLYHAHIIHHPYFQCCTLMSYRQLTSRHFLMNVSICSQPWKTQPFQELYGRKMCKTNIYRLKKKGEERLKCKTCFQQKCHPSFTADN